MLIKKSLIIAVSYLIVSSLAIAGTAGSITPTEGFKAVGTISGGGANIKTSAGRVQQFIGTDDQLFLYKGENTSKTRGVLGGFLGIEHSLPRPGFFMQAGIEYNNFNSVHAHGVHWVGIEPETSTFYRYSYDIRTRQALAVVKLFTTTSLPMISAPPLFPYFSVGLGTAFNSAKGYSASTPESGSINLTPEFNNRTRTSFSYSLGVGVDTPVSEHARIGINYQFSGLSRASLGDGQIVINQYVYHVPFSIQSPNLYTNQVGIHFSYIL